MSVKLVPEKELRAALRPYRVEPNAFEAGIRERIKADEEYQQDEDSQEQSPLLKAAAAFLPWPLVAGGKLAGSGVKLSSLPLGQKLLGYAALPAISLFCLAGAAFFSVAKIRRIQKDNQPNIGNEEEMHAAVRQWWGRYKWVALLVFAAVLIVPMIGSTWLLFLLLLVSFGSLLGFLSGFAKFGVGNRLMIARSCLMGLVFLGQTMLNPFAGRRDIHFVDQTLIAVVFFVGTLMLLPFLVGMKRLEISGPAIERKEKVSTWILLICGFVFADGLLVFGLSLVNAHSLAVGGYRWLLLAAVIVVQVAVLISMSVRRFRTPGASRFTAGWRWIIGLFYVCLAVPMIACFTNPIWRPTTPARIQHHVETFEEGRYPSIAWRDWEITASWAIEAGLNPDLSRARELLAGEISDDQLLLSLVLDSAFRVGVVQTGQIEGLAEIKQIAMYKRHAGFEKIRRSLIPENKLSQPHAITSLNQHAWAIYALNQSGQLSPEDRDFLEQRLLATLDELEDRPGYLLETALRATQLLEVIDRPIDRDQYRARVHEWLREFHSQKTHFYQIAGGFEKYKGVSASLQATSHAIELMEIYGVPDGLDLNWVRSFLRPLYFRPANDKWIAAVTLDRLNRLPNVAQPTWLERLYYERSLIAAMVLVLLCIYATWSSPIPINPPDDAELSCLG